MERIASFCVDHNTLVPGMYLSRKDGDVLTWDIRMKTPNKGSYLSPACAHTIEHLFATYARNSKWSEHVIYVGPMGCLTGFYLLTRGLTDAEALALTQESFAWMAEYDGDIPGASAVECGLPDDGPGGSTTGMQGYERSSAKAGCRPYALPGEIRLR